VAFGVAIFFTAWQVAILIGWDVAAAMFVAWVWLSVGRLDSATTAKVATIEEPSRRTADLILVVSCLVSLLGVGAVLLKASGEQGLAKALLIVVATMSLLLSWSSIHTLFTLRYASLYYLDGGGIEFSGDRTPDYGDFAYLAFTIGMTYQVSDTTLTNKSIRMTVLRHAFLSFVFGTGVIAAAINIVAGLLK